MGSCVSRPVSKKHDRHQPKPSAVGPPPPKKPQEFFPSTLPHSGSKDEPFYDTQPWLESDCDDDFYSVDGDTPRRNSFVAHRFSVGTPLARTSSHGNTGTIGLVKTSSTHSRTSTPLLVNTRTPQSNKPGEEKQPAGYTPENYPTVKKKRLSELFRLSRGGYAEEFNFNDNMSVDTKTVSGSVFTSVPSSQFVSDATSVCSSARTSNVSVESRRSKAHKLIYPVGCLNKLLAVRHKNEKEMDVRSIQDQG